MTRTIAENFPGHLRSALLCLLVVLLWSVPAAAQSIPSAAPTAKIDVQKLPPAGHTQNFDPDKATNAYLATISGAARERSDAYFEGGYVLLFVDTLYAVAVAALLLWLRISARMRNIAQGITRHRFLQVPLYVMQYIVITTILLFPLTLYENFFREHSYGLSNQNFMQWFGDFAKSFGVEIVGATIFLTIVYAVVRVTKERWWVWGSIIAVAFLAITMMIAPVFIAPLFNHYQPLKESPLKAQILSMARAQGIPVNNVYMNDASRQSKRISANVSGFMGTTRVTLNDNLLNRATPAEIKAVMGHEMGHYVLGHSTMLLIRFGLVILVGFWFVNWGFRILAGIFGGNWDVRTIDDPAGLPAIAALFSVYMLVMTPVTNTIIRTAEAQADIFGLNAAREPDGFATVSLKLSQYRKLDPSPWEEFIFYDHPSGRSRISMAMHWKAEHLGDPDIQAGPVSPQ